MTNIAIRPDMRTSGGEVSDILLNGRYVGGITLVYQEGNRLSGSVQLEKSSLPYRGKEKVMQYIQEYVNACAAATDVKDCDVIVTYSHFDQIIAMEHNVGEIIDFIDDDRDSRYFDTDRNDDEAGYEARYKDRYDARDAGRVDGNSYEARYKGHNAGYVHDIGYDADDDDGEYGYDADDEFEEVGYETRAASGSHTQWYELVITGEHEDSIEYHIYGRNKTWLAEVFVTLLDTDCKGEMNWMIRPTPEQIEHAVDLLVSDFDEDLIDSFQLDIKYNGELLEVYELVHEEIADFSGMSDHAWNRDHDTVTRNDDGMIPDTENEVTYFV